MFAGRNISVTHVALGTTRVMATCAVEGQAVGTSAYLCLKYGITPREVGQKHIKELQQLLLKNDAYIIGVRNEDESDIALKSTVTASSCCLLEVKEGEMVHWLDTSYAQMFPIPEQKIKTISLLFESVNDNDTEITIGLRQAKKGGDFSENKDFAASSAIILGRGRYWVDFHFNQEISSGLYWIWLPETRGIGWCYKKGNILGTWWGRFDKNDLSWKYEHGFNNVDTWMREEGCHCFKVIPPIRAFEGENVLNGISRPANMPNIWISDPNEQFPQWVELNFGGPQKFNTVYLTFDTDLDSNIFKKKDERVISKCVKDYTLYAYREKQWTKILSRVGNYHRRQIHQFDNIIASRLKVVVESTNGDSSARIYEIRVYLDR